MNDLIEALQIFLKYTGDVQHPTHCEHDVMYIRCDKSSMSAEDVDRLDALGFFQSGEQPECFISYRFGSA